MLLFYVRHGDPIYVPDSLTPLGLRQAEAIGKRLAMFGVDEIYSSTSERAKLTAKPLCELLKKDMTLLDFANENHAWRDLTCFRPDGTSRTWLFSDEETVSLFNTPEIYDLGQRWYEHPAFNEEKYAEEKYKEGIERIREYSRDFLLSLGYERVGAGKYRVVKENEGRVALFAHAGFGLAFLSELVGIPYPAFTSHFDMCHSGLTVIEFKNEGGFAYPKILTLSSDAHLYKEGLPTRYNGREPF